MSTPAPAMAPATAAAPAANVSLELRDVVQEYERACADAGAGRVAFTRDGAVVAWGASEGSVTTWTPPEWRERTVALPNAGSTATWAMCPSPTTA